MRKLQGFAISSAGFVENCGAWFIFYETYLGFVRNLKRFRSEGSFAVSSWRTILGFVEFFYCIFRHFNSFRSFLTSTEPF